MLKLILKYPPSVNQYWRSKIVTSKYKPPFINVYISSKGIQFKEDVLYDTIKQKVYNKRISHNIRVIVFLYPPDKRIRDVDNPMKALLDSLGKKGAKVYLDDSQIKDLRIIMKEPNPKLGKTEILIFEMDDPNGQVIFE